MGDLFPPVPVGFANENFKSLLSTLRDTIKDLSAGPDSVTSVTPPVAAAHNTIAYETTSRNSDTESHDAPNSSRVSEAQALLRRVVDEREEEQPSGHSSVLFPPQIN